MKKTPHNITVFLLAALLSAAVSALPVDGARDWPVPEELARCVSPAGLNLLSGSLFADWSGGAAALGLAEVSNGELLLLRIGDKLALRHEPDGVTLWQASDNIAAVAQPELQGRAYHLVLDAPEGRQHLLFALADDGIGQLVWSGPTHSVVTECHPGSFTGQALTAR